MIGGNFGQLGGSGRVFAPKTRATATDVTPVFSPRDDPKSRQQAQQTHDKAMGGEAVNVSDITRNPAFGAAAEEFATTLLNLINDPASILSVALSDEEKKVLENAKTVVPQKVKDTYPSYDKCLAKAVKLYSLQAKIAELGNVQVATENNIKKRIKASKAMITGGLDKAATDTVLKHLKHLQYNALHTMGYISYGTWWNKKDDNMTDVTGQLSSHQDANNDPLTVNNFSALPVPSGQSSPLVPVELLLQQTPTEAEGGASLWKSKFLSPEVRAKYMDAGNPLNPWVPSVKYMRSLEFPFAYFYGQFNNYTPSSIPEQYAYDPYQGAPSTGFPADSFYGRLRPTNWWKKKLYRKVASGVPWGSSSYYLDSFNANEQIKSKVLQPSSGGVVIPKHLYAIGAPWFNYGQKLQPGDVYVPKFTGKEADAVRMWARANTKNKMRVDALWNSAALAEEWLMELMRKMNILEQALLGYSKIQQAEDELFFSQTLAAPFSAQFLVNLVAKGGGNGTVDDINKLLMQVYGKSSQPVFGKYLKAQEEIGKANKTLQALTKGVVTVWTPQGEYFAFPACAGLPGDVTLLLQLIAKGEALAGAALGESKVAKGLADKIKDLSNKINMLTNGKGGLVELTDKKLKLDKALDDCLKKRTSEQYNVSDDGDAVTYRATGSGVFGDAGEVTDACEKIKTARANLVKKRTELAEEISALARVEGRRSEIRQLRNNLGDANVTEAQKPEGVQVDVVLPTEEKGSTKPVKIKVKLSSGASVSISDAEKTLDDAQKQADEANAQTLNNLNITLASLGKTGVGSLVTTDEKISQVVIPEFIQPHVNAKPPFPWLMLIAGGLGAAKAIPVAAAAAVGAVGAVQYSKAKKAFDELVT